MNRGGAPQDVSITSVCSTAQKSVMHIPMRFPLQIMKGNSSIGMQAYK